MDPVSRYHVIVIRHRIDRVLSLAWSLFSCVVVFSGVIPIVLDIRMCSFQEETECACINMSTSASYSL
jgi:hypothetical protein